MCNQSNGAALGNNPMKSYDHELEGEKRETLRAIQAAAKPWGNPSVGDVASRTSWFIP
jgi:hypothetical protein